MNSLYSNFAISHFNFAKRARTVVLLRVSEEFPKVPTHDLRKTRKCNHHSLKNAPCEQFDLRAIGHC